MKKVFEREIQKDTCVQTFQGKLKQIDDFICLGWKSRDL
jgi:hypothetical protein